MSEDPRAQVDPGRRPTEISVLPQRPLVVTGVLLSRVEHEPLEVREADGACRSFGRRLPHGDMVALPRLTRPVSDG